MEFNQKSTKADIITEATDCIDFKEEQIEKQQTVIVFLLFIATVTSIM